MNEQELNQKFQIFERKIIQVQEQIIAVDQAILDMKYIDFGLDDLNGKTNEEIMAPIGRGIYVKAKLLSEELIVDVGGQNFIPKNISSTKELIQGQIKNLSGLKKELEKELNEINKEITQIMEEFRKNSPKK